MSYVQGVYLACVLSILLLVCVHARDYVFSVVCHGLCAWCCVLRVSDWCCVSSFVCPALYIAWYCLTLHVWHCVPRVWTWHFELRVYPALGVHLCVPRIWVLLCAPDVCTRHVLPSCELSAVAPEIGPGLGCLPVGV